MIAPDVGDHDLHAVRGECLGLPERDAAAAAGDECNFAREIFHGASSERRIEGCGPSAADARINPAAKIATLIQRCMARARNFIALVVEAGGRGHAHPGARQLGRREQAARRQQHAFAAAGGGQLVGIAAEIRPQVHAAGGRPGDLRAHARAGLPPVRARHSSSRVRTRSSMRS